MSYTSYTKELRQVTQVGITERGDAALSEDWVDWVYKKSKPAILITKNVILLQEKYPDIFFKNVVIHVTCTGLGGTILEPNVPSYKDILNWLKSKPESIRQRLVLRVDPICPSLFYCPNEAFNGEDYYNAVQDILLTANELKLRCRVSFLDMYKHVADRFRKLNISVGQLYSNDSIHLPLNFREKNLNFFKENFVQDIELEVCGEPGMECTGCVSQKDLDILRILGDFKDLQGQRPACNCLAVKRELLNVKSQCGHKCVYCYWT